MGRRRYNKRAKPTESKHCGCCGGLLTSDRGFSNHLASNDSCRASWQQGGTSGPVVLPPGAPEMFERVSHFHDGGGLDEPPIDPMDSSDIDDDPFLPPEGDDDDDDPLVPVEDNDDDPFLLVPLVVDDDEDEEGKSSSTPTSTQKRSNRKRLLCFGEDSDDDGSDDDDDEKPADSDIAGSVDGEAPYFDFEQEKEDEANTHQHEGPPTIESSISSITTRLDSIDEESKDEDETKVSSFHQSIDFPRNVADIANVELSSVCRSFGMPLGAFHAIQTWAFNQAMRGHNFQLEPTHYRTFIKGLTDLLELENLDHRMESIILPWGGTHQFPVFDFRSMVLHLLDDPRINRSLLINWDDPSSVPPYDPRYYDEIHSAKWYQRTHAQRIVPQSRQTLAGVLLFIDRTHTAEKDRLGCECVYFTLSILPRAIRNQPWAWRPLGMLPKFTRSNLRRGQKNGAYHQVLSVVLQGLHSAQQLGGIETFLVRPDTREEVDLTLVTPILLGLGDVEGHDKQCSRVASHNTHYLSRECDCTTESADDPDVVCNRTSASTISKMVEDDDDKGLVALGYYNVVNAYSRMDFGENEYGINGCCPGEALHSIKSGIIKYCIDIFYSSVVNKENVPCTFFDRLTAEVGVLMSHQSDRDYPRTSFPNAVSQTSQLNSDEYPGVLLVDVIALYSHSCWSPSRVDSSSAGYAWKSLSCFDSINVEQVEQYRKLFEILLCYVSWFQVEKVSKQSIDDGTVLAASRNLIRALTETSQRDEGLQWKLTKVHAPLHVPWAVEEYGSNQNVNSGPCEKNHKENVKKPAKNTQKRKSNFEMQIAKRMSEDLTVKTAQLLVSEANAKKIPSSVEPKSALTPDGGTRFKLTVGNSEDANGDYCLHRSFSWLSTHRNDHPNKTPPDAALDFLPYLVQTALDENFIGCQDVTFCCFTELKKGGHIYRAHPNYRRSGEWFDWAYVHFASNDESEGESYPSQIWYFLDLREPMMLPTLDDGATEDLRPMLPGWLDGDDSETAGLYAVVTSMEKKPAPLTVCHSFKRGESASSKKDRLNTCTSSILKTGRRHNKLLLVPVCSINAPAMVLDNPGREAGHEESLIVVTPRSSWPDLFLENK